jgi:hypothetical protein
MVCHQTRVIWLVFSVFGIFELGKKRNRMRSQMRSKVKPVLNINEKVRLRVENEYISWRSKK